MIGFQIKFCFVAKDGLRLSKKDHRRISLRIMQPGGGLRLLSRPALRAAAQAEKLPMKIGLAGELKILQMPGQLAWELMMAAALLQKAFPAQRAIARAQQHAA